MYLYVYIRRPLPELERARLQLQSPMPSNPASPKPSNPDTPRGIRASKHPSIPDCRNPLFDHLKGVTDPSRRTPQDATGDFSIRTLTSPPSPLALKSVLPPARECQIHYLVPLAATAKPTRHPSRAPARPLPELERASLQLQSPMPSNPASPKPANPDTPPGIRASKHPSIPDCRNPLFDHLKGMSLIRHRPPQAAKGSTAGQSLSPPHPTLALKPELPPLREC